MSRGNTIGDLLHRLVPKEATKPSTRSEPYIYQHLPYFKHMKDREALFPPKPLFIETQPEIRADHRQILIDWLSEVAVEYRLPENAVYLAVNYCDRFLSQSHVPRDKLQLVGVTALFIANKFVTADHRAVTDYSYICDNSFTVNQIIKTESAMVRALGFVLASPTIFQFLMEYFSLSTLQLTKKAKILALYLCELSLQDYTCVSWKPSQIAYAAICLSRFICGDSAWNASFIDVDGYDYNTVGDCIRRLKEIFETAKTHNLRAVREKFCTTEYRPFNVVTGIAESVPYLNCDALPC
ncbi:hypothetical protein GEMRC1_008323 [Eukaryota sp. GEM-RC1]